MSLEKDRCITQADYGIKGSTPEQILRNISWKMSLATGLTTADMSTKLFSLNRRNESNLESGLMIYDWMDEKIKTPFVYLAHLDSPVDFKSIDDRPVDFILALISPESQSITHLRHLARLTRIFRDDSLLNRLRKANCTDGLLSILSPENQRNIAA